MDRRATLRLGAGLFAASLLPREAAACRVFPADGALSFTALRRGEPIGRQGFRFARDGRLFTVRADADWTVPAAPSARYVHHAEEIWRNGWLDAVVSDTDDAGRRYRVRAERRGGIFGGTVNGAAFTVSGYIIPASLWHRDTPATQVLFDLVDARVKVVRGEYLGEDEVSVAGASVRAKRYSLTGELERQLWYDSDCALVRAELIPGDGVPITLEAR